MTNDNSFSILSLNMHKGRGISGKSTLAMIRSSLHIEVPDILFLQEVVGEKLSRKKESITSHHLHIAEGQWPHAAYGQNFLHRKGHHGNAILSKFPIIYQKNIDVSAYWFEKRGILHTVLEIAKDIQLHCFCIHFGLLRKGRRSQLLNLVKLVQATVPKSSPLIIAGDFNDWTKDSSHMLNSELETIEVFEKLTGKVALSFPRFFPLLPLDRIYFRNLQLNTSSIISVPGSDHCALTAQFEYPQAS